MSVAKIGTRNCHSKFQKMDVYKSITLGKMKTLLFTQAIVTLILLSGSLNAQTLWNVDVQDVEAAKSWQYDEGIYMNSSDASAAGFTGISYIPEAGFVFYIEDATIDDYHKVYNELVEKFGTEDLNKDYIDPTIPFGRKNISAKVHEESINQGHTYVYREWNEGDTKIRFFWNQYRFWVEAVKVK